MVVLKTQSEVGHAPPPQAPYSVITNLPGWDVARAIREGDPAPMKKLVHIYPRFMPTHYSAQLGHEIAKRLGHTDKAALVYLNPAVWPYTLHHVTHENRGDKRLKVQDATLKCVDIAGHRVYLILVSPTAMPAVVLTWQNPGLGISIRGAEDLLKSIDTIKEVPFEAEKGPIPSPTWTPESEAHGDLRTRIVELLHRAPVDADKVKCTPSDVFLYPTGMAAIFHSSVLLTKHRPGTIVVLGIIFHNTYHHLIEECPQGMKHFGKVDKEGLSVFEDWLKHEKEEGRPVSHVFVEVPGNPTLETVDTKRLKELSEEYGFSWADFLERTKILNRNALAMANFLHKAISIPDSPVVNVQYPCQLGSKSNYDAILRRATPELPEPGYGCLLTVEFSTVEAAIAFYDRAGFYPSPHLGGHVTIMFAYNMVVFGKKPDEKAYMHELGVREASVRISAGLENEEDLVDTLRDALEVATKVKKGLETGH
ncbi:hypothetical protein FOTG_06010 [Fusarium oxysporum f. sp. vasinfectum 25433]|uniref:Cystathionine gamma-synthase n=1 Tax=Fusarium oxysporum f. sp. vasinfectum 25433 TaxID=1089449 RepID=X0N4G1_FUSOX|nr:hypothetical protein FOTG_06010 [Fusarium oxysporum f. sp. vasinfectum 25433]